MYKLQFCTFIFAVLLQLGRHWFSITSTEILAIWQSFVVFSPYFSDIELQRYCGHDFDLSGQVTSSVMWSLDWIPMCGFLLVVNMNWPCISHGCRDIELLRYLGHDLDLLGSRDVICHVTIWIRNSYKWSIRTDHLSRTVITIHYGQLSFTNVSASNTAKWENFEIFENFKI